MPMTRHQVPRCVSSTAKACFSAGARNATTRAATPKTIKTAATNMTKTAYSEGVGFLDGGKKSNITTKWLTYRRRERAVSA